VPKIVFLESTPFGALVGDLGKVKGSEIAQALKTPTSSNVHYVYMLLFHSL